MKINGKTVTGNSFAYDGCHKIYIIEDTADEAGCAASGYQVLPISELKQVYKESCPLRFISNWKLDKNYAPQGKAAKFGR